MDLFDTPQVKPDQMMAAIDGAAVFAGLNLAATSTTASAGSAALPAAPEGFVEVLIGGATYKVPFYLP